MRTKITCLSVLIVFSLAACGGGSSSGPSNGDTGNPDEVNNIDTSGSLSFYGFIGVTDDAGSEITVNGGFSQFSAGVSAEAFRAGIGALNDAPDTCEVTVSDNIIVAEDDDIDIEIPNISVNFVSAGEVIPFTSAAGSFAELARTVVVGITAYTLAGNPPGGVPGPIPADLVFNIPGDVYPAFSNVAVPDMMPMVTISPATNTPLTGDTVFSWDADAGSEAVISIGASGFAQTVVDNLPVVSFAQLRCDVVDDGSFTLPTATQSEISASGINFTFSSITRTLSRLEQSSNAALIVTRASEN